MLWMIKKVKLVILKKVHGKARKVTINKEHTGEKIVEKYRSAMKLNRAIWKSKFLIAKFTKEIKVMKNSSQKEK